MKSTLVIVDANNLAHRNFNALPKWMSANGEKTNTTFGFMRCIHGYLEKYNADDIIIVFDGAGSTLKRKEIDKEYKSDRVKDFDDSDCFWKQVGRIKEILKSMNILVLESKNVEADDVIYSLAISKSELYNQVIIVTSDHDLLQACWKDNIKVLRNNVVKGDVLWDNAKILKEMDYEANKLIYYWALIGDSGDCIPSACTPTIAKAIMSKNVVDRDSLLRALEEANWGSEDIQRALQNLKLIQAHSIDSEELSDLEIPKIFFEGARSYYEKLEMKSLIKKLDKAKLREDLG